MVYRRFGFLALFAVFWAGGDVARAQDRPWPVKVVIVTTFEVGADKGDRPGELQLWAERDHLDQVVDFPGGVHPILASGDHQEIAVLTGMSLVNAGASVMALGLDPRFDLSHAYWIVAGIGGVDPHIASVGSAAWARFVINDVANEIDPREAPKNWAYGRYVPGTKAPGTLAGANVHDGTVDGYPLVYKLNAGLADWALEQTKDIKLPFDDEMRAYAANWKGFPAAQLPPKVMLGDSFASDIYWHGALLTDYARNWVQILTDGQGVFAMSNMEDSAIAEAMRRLNRMGRADFNRLMFLRTGSNYTMQHQGQTAFASLSAPYPGNGMPAYEAAYAVGGKVARTLINGWAQYAAHIPGGSIASSR